MRVDAPGKVRLCGKWTVIMTNTGWLDLSLPFNMRDVRVPCPLFISVSMMCELKHFTSCWLPRVSGSNVYLENTGDVICNS